VTTSSDFQLAAQGLRRAKQALIQPVDSLTSWGLHLAGLPSHADVRELGRQVGELQREVLALRRELVEAQRNRRRPQ
jgi:hypothetical protein